MENPELEDKVHAILNGQSTVLPRTPDGDKPAKSSYDAGKAPLHFGLKRNNASFALHFVLREQPQP
jgi:hypothetical protein